MLIPLKHFFFLISVQTYYIGTWELIWFSHLWNLSLTEPTFMFLWPCTICYLVPWERKVFQLGREPMSPALEGWCVNHWPPGKSQTGLIFKWINGSRCTEGPVLSLSPCRWLSPTLEVPSKAASEKIVTQSKHTTCFCLGRNLEFEFAFLFNIYLLGCVRSCCSMWHSLW